VTSPTRPLGCTVAAATDVAGTRAEHAAQLLVVHPEHASVRAQHGVLVVVSAGTSPPHVGALAARLAVEAVAGRYAHALARRDPRAALLDAVQVANRTVHDVGRAMVPARRLGTTCTAFVLRGDAAYCAHVGDARLYLARGGALFHMTEDHSVAMQRAREGTLRVREAEWHADRRVLARVLGHEPEVEVSSWPTAFAVCAGDRFLLCTRTVHERLSESVLQDAMRADAPREGCAALIAQARAAGAVEPLAVSIVAH
jgi:PPM family protein phosphatase